MAKQPAAVVRKKKPAAARKQQREAPQKDKNNQPSISQLQQQAGNQAVLKLLTRGGLHAKKTDATSNAGQEERDEMPKTQVEVGTVAFAKPRVEYYDVTGRTLDEVRPQLLKDGKWYTHEYRYALKSENDGSDSVITRVDITVQTTLRLPRWTGKGWEQASRADKLAWTAMLGQETPPKETHEHITRLPSAYVGVDWAQAPDALKAQWLGMLQKIHSQELSPRDAVLRRVMVLQQRLFDQPEKQAKAIFEAFIHDLKVELEAYNRQLKFGQKQQISLGVDTLIA